MTAYLLCHLDYNTLHLVAADTAVEAAKLLCDHLGCPPYQEENTETGQRETNISVSGSYPIVEGVLADVSGWWPHFSSYPRLVSYPAKDGADERKVGS